MTDVQQVARQMPAQTHKSFGMPFRTQAPDRVPIGGFAWRHDDPSPSRPIVIIAAATSVRCRYYSRFADHLFENGFDVVTFDYRGIGESRPRSLRGFRADWVDWGEHDLEAAIRFAEANYPRQPIRVVAHSIGGFAVGLAPSSHRIDRILTVGAQYAHWRDYGAAHRRRMYVRWHIVMPMLTKLWGYFPAGRLGWMEDTPAGVVRDWSRMTARFEDTVRPGKARSDKREVEGLVRRFGGVTAPLLAIGLDDDPFGTPAALERLLAYFTASAWRHWRIAPADIGVPSIGHFSFFHDRFKQSLWPLALAWLQAGEVPAAAPGRLWRTAVPRRDDPC
jgi:predicted alpha/beta hydrolase